MKKEKRRVFFVGEITAITPQAKDKTRCNVYVDGRFCCGLTMETVVKNRLKPGQSVSPERLEEMQLESEKNTAFDKALTHLSATRKTEKEIR
jgi:regulatory protein